MTEIEQKALALVNEANFERGYALYSLFSRKFDLNCEALCRAIEQHEAFRQEVSDIAEAHLKHAFTVQEKHLSGYKVTVGFEKQKDATAWFDQLLSLPKFIIPKPKPDPLAQTLGDFDGTLWEPEDVLRFRAALEARGFEIREKNDD